MEEPLRCVDCGKTAAERARYGDKLYMNLFTEILCGACFADRKDKVKKSNGTHDQSFQ